LTIRIGVVENTVTLEQALTVVREAVFCRYLILEIEQVVLSPENLAARTEHGSREAFEQTVSKVPDAKPWVWNQPEVSLLLSGMSTFEQVVQNVESAGRSGVGLLSDAELALIDRVREQYRALSAIPCTKCEYCQPCPNGVKIPTIFEVYNELVMYGDEGRARWFYSTFPEDKRADACTECGECLEKCPQHIEIPEWLKKVHAVLCEEKALPA